MSHLPESGWQTGIVDAKRGVQQLILVLRLRALHSTAIIQESFLRAPGAARIDDMFFLRSEGMSTDTSEIYLQLFLGFCSALSTLHQRPEACVVLQAIRHMHQLPSYQPTLIV